MFLTLHICFPSKFLKFSAMWTYHRINFLKMVPKPCGTARPVWQACFYLQYGSINAQKKFGFLLFQPLLLNLFFRQSRTKYLEQMLNFYVSEAPPLSPCNNVDIFGLQAAWNCCSTLMEGGGGKKQKITEN